MGHHPRRPRAPILTAWACCGVLSALGACGGPRHPPLLKEPGAVDGGESFYRDAELTPPMCKLGPEGGVCACVDQPLLGDVPNLYFVLDRSGSMKDLNKWTIVETVLGHLVIDLGPRANVGVAVFPDPAVDQCAPGVEVFATRRGDSAVGRVGAVATTLLTILGHISASGGTPTAATLIALAPKIQSLPGRTVVILATDGGPNCNPNAACGIAQCQPNIESTSGCVPAGPVNCCNGPTFGGAYSCLDAQPTIDATSALALSGIPVYVVGVPGSAPYAALLDTLAQVGGRPRATEPLYYAVDTADQSALESALKKIAARVTGTCTLKLDGVPPDPALVNVFLDEHALPQSGADGWTLTDDTVTVQGASCQRILGGDVLDVRVVGGCPTVLL